MDLVINDDVEFESGDLKISDSKNQCIYAILKARPGQFYQHPTLGVGVDDYENASIDERELKRAIRKELKKDNYRIEYLNISFIDSELNVEIIGDRK